MTGPCMMQVKPENNPLRRGYSASSMRDLYEQVELEQSRLVFTKEQVMDEICYFLREHDVFENYYKFVATGETQVLAYFFDEYDDEMSDHNSDTETEAHSPQPPPLVLRSFSDYEFDDFKCDVLNNNWKSMGWEACIDDDRTIFIEKIEL